MTRTRRNALLLCAVLLAGCAASTAKGDNWAYTGSDPALRNPP